MNVVAVESSVLASIAYDDDSGILQLEFHSGKIYQYFGVPAAVCEGLLRASSKGEYFNEFIGGHFPFALTGKAQTGGV